MEQEYEQREDLNSENYEEPQPERPPDGQPVPADFTDYDDFVKAVVDFRVKQVAAPTTQATGAPDALDYANYDTFVDALVDYRLKQALSQPPQPPTPTQPPFNDDPHGAERAELIRQSLDYSKEALMAREAGDTKKFHDWRERQRQVERDLAKLPPPPEVEYAQKMFEELDSKGVDLLYREDLADHPMWDAEKMQNDSSVVVARSNKAAKKMLRLPAEVSEWGSIEPCKPSTMMKVELPPEAMKAFKVQVYGQGDADPETIFRRSWQTLRKMGYATQAERAFEPKKKAEKETGGKPHKDPDGMTQAEFTKWRESQGARRF